MNANEKTNWARKAVKVMLVALAVLVIVMYPRVGVVIATAAVVAYAFGKVRTDLTGAPVYSVFAAPQKQAPEKVPSKAEVMRCWVALF
jgi:hypothetical protein